MSRKDELRKLVGDNEVLIKAVDDLIFCETQLEHLRTLPHIVVSKTDPNLQKDTVASRQYIKYLQQYNNLIKTISKAIGVDTNDNESPLRAWIKANE